MQSEFGTNDYEIAEISDKFYYFHPCDIKNDTVSSVTDDAE